MFNYYKMKKDIKQQLQYTTQLKPRIIGSIIGLNLQFVLMFAFSLIFRYDTVVRGHSQTMFTRFCPLLTFNHPITMQ